MPAVRNERQGGVEPPHSIKGRAPFDFAQDKRDARGESGGGLSGGCNFP